MDSISKEDFLQHTSNHGDADKKTYYSFTFNGLKFIVLDANHNLDGAPYDKGNFDWTKAFILSVILSFGVIYLFYISFHRGNEMYAIKK